MGEYTKRLKALGIELDNTRSALDSQAKLIDRIKAWLVEEVNDGQDVVDAKENKEDYVTSDGTDDIIIGRHECAECLLGQIEKWENQ